MKISAKGFFNNITHWDGFMIDSIGNYLFRQVSKMKTGIHPDLKNTKVVCTGCGHEFETLSVKDQIVVSICSNCHPFFTGTKKLLDTEGRIQKFEKRYKQAQEQSQKQKEQGQKHPQKKKEEGEGGQKKTILKKIVK